MSTTAATPATSRLRAAARLQELRVRAACRVHKSIGDSEEIRRDGLEAFEALRDIRERANTTIDDCE